MITLSDKLRFCTEHKGIEGTVYKKDIASRKTQYTRDRANNGNTSDTNIVLKREGIGTVQPIYTIGLCKDCREWDILFIIRTRGGPRNVCKACYGEYLGTYERKVIG